jgi:hypothetical protein
VSSRQAIHTTNLHPSGTIKPAVESMPIQPPRNASSTCGVPVHPVPIDPAPLLGFAHMYREFHYRTQQVTHSKGRTTEPLNPTNPANPRPFAGISPRVGGA